MRVRSSASVQPIASRAREISLDRRTARQRRPLGGCCCWGCPIVAARRAKKAPDGETTRGVWRRPRTSSPRRLPQRSGAPRPARVLPVRRRSPRARPAAPRPRTCSRTPSWSAEPAPRRRVRSVFFLVGISRRRNNELATRLLGALLHRRRVVCLAKAIGQRSAPTGDVFGSTSTDLRSPSDGPAARASERLSGS